MPSLAGLFPTETGSLQRWGEWAICPRLSLCHDKAQVSCSCGLPFAWCYFLRSPTPCDFSVSAPPPSHPQLPVTQSHPLPESLANGNHECSLARAQGVTGTSRKSGIPPAAKEERVETDDSPRSGGRGFEARGPGGWQEGLLCERTGHRSHWERTALSSRQEKDQS